ncbi:MAG: hypothetical protein KAS63_01125 [Candidatus Heimdallarchaeota archaeon]|nr:hypothetical protein [Candidatus Heimdallarchaeota archaeon]MCK4953945.1 hypothetical protein [Candidatus Heimdallarchaeota archaeon]
MNELSKKNVYIACSMIKSKKIDFSLLDLIKNWAELQKYSTFVPVKMAEGSPVIVFERDMSWLKGSSVIVADVNEPSHGVGMEIMYAYNHDIPVVCLLDEKNKPLSRMVEGSPHILLVSYEEEKDLEKQLGNLKLEEMKVNYCESCYEKTIHIKKVCTKCEKN